jgi:hypothetical protein
MEHKPSVSASLKGAIILFVILAMLSWIFRLPQFLFGFATVMTVLIIAAVLEWIRKKARH